MKTIATAAVFAMLTASAWADEPKKQTPVSAQKPIVLSEAAMDAVTAGMTFKPLHDRVLVRRIESDDGTSTTSSSLSTAIDAY